MSDKNLNLNQSELIVSQINRLRDAAFTGSLKLELHFKGGVIASVGLEHRQATSYQQFSLDTIIDQVKIRSDGE